MKVLLLKFIPKVGSQGDVVDVADGYAKNALIAKKLAIPATPQHMHEWNQKKEKERNNKAARKEAIKKIIPLLQKHVFASGVKTGEGDAVFTSVHQDEIQKLVVKFLSVENKIFSTEDVHLDIKPIKELGEHSIPIRIGRENDIVKTQITLKIVGIQ